MKEVSDFCLPYFNDATVLRRKMRSMAPPDLRGGVSRQCVGSSYRVRFSSFAAIFIGFHGIICGYLCHYVVFPYDVYWSNQIKIPN